MQSALITVVIIHVKISNLGLTVFNIIKNNVLINLFVTMSVDNNLCNAVYNSPECGMLRSRTMENTNINGMAKC